MCYFNRILNKYIEFNFNFKNLVLKILKKNQFFKTFFQKFNPNIFLI